MVLSAISKKGSARPDSTVTPYMPCSFSLLPCPRSGTRRQPNGLLEVTVIVRWIPLVTAACGTWLARPAGTTIVRTCRRRLPAPSVATARPR